MAVPVSTGSNPDLTPRQTRILAGIIVVIGVFLLNYGYSQHQTKQAHLENAETISATMTDAGFEIRQNTRSQGPEYEVTAGFRYTYNGTAYESTFIYPLDDEIRVNERLTAESFINDYSEGNNVTAYVPQRAPDKAYLQKDEGQNPMLHVLMGSILVLLGAIAAIQNRNK